MAAREPHLLPFVASYTMVLPDAAHEIQAVGHEADALAGMAYDIHRDLSTIQLLRRTKGSHLTPLEKLYLDSVVVPVANRQLNKVVGLAAPLNLGSNGQENSPVTSYLLPMDASKHLASYEPLQATGDLVATALSFLQLRHAAPDDRAGSCDTTQPTSSNCKLKRGGAQRSPAPTQPQSLSDGRLSTDSAKTPSTPNMPTLFEMPGTDLDLSLLQTCFGYHNSGDSVLSELESCTEAVTSSLTANGPAGPPPSQQSTYERCQIMARQFESQQSLSNNSPPAVSPNNALIEADGESEVDPSVGSESDDDEKRAVSPDSAIDMSNESLEGHQVSQAVAPSPVSGSTSPVKAQPGGVARHRRSTSLCGDVALPPRGLRIVLQSLRNDSKDVYKSHSKQSSRSSTWISSHLTPIFEDAPDENRLSTSSCYSSEPSTPSSEKLVCKPQETIQAVPMAVPVPPEDDQHSAVPDDQSETLSIQDLLEDLGIADSLDCEAPFLVEMENCDDLSTTPRLSLVVPTSQRSTPSLESESTPPTPPARSLRRSYSVSQSEVSQCSPQRLSVYLDVDFCAQLQSIDFGGDFDHKLNLAASLLGPPPGPPPACAPPPLPASALASLDEVPPAPIPKRHMSVEGLTSFEGQAAVLRPDASCLHRTESASTTADSQRSFLTRTDSSTIPGLSYAEQVRTETPELTSLPHPSTINGVRNWPRPATAMSNLSHSKTDISFQQLKSRYWRPKLHVMGARESLLG